MRKTPKSFIYQVYYDSEFRVAPPYRLWQVGEQKLHPGESIPEHEQQVAEISLILSGKATFYVNRTAFPVGEGSVFLNGVSEIHSIAADLDSPLHMLFMGFMIDPVEGDSSIAALRRFFCHPPKRILTCERAMIESFRAVMAEVHAVDLMSNGLIAAHMQALLCTLYRSAEKSGAASRDRKPYEYSDNRLIYNVLEYLNSQEGLDENLSQISDRLGYSYAWLEKQFKEVMGETLSVYHMRRRFEQAKHDLRRGKSVTDVAAHLGYSSASTFSRAFRRYYGLSPSKFLKMNGDAPENEM